jgi:ABC-type transport system involved in cytochrome c biogenesis permease component
MGLAVAFFGITVVLALATARMAPTQLGLWVLGSWLAKMVLIIAVLALLRDQDFYSRPALFLALLVGTAGSLLLEARIVATTKVPYVEPAGR